MRSPGVGGLGPQKHHHNFGLLSFSIPEHRRSFPRSTAQDTSETPPNENSQGGAPPKDLSARGWDFLETVFCCRLGQATEPQKTSRDFAPRAPGPRGRNREKSPREAGLGRAVSYGRFPWLRARPLSPSGVAPGHQLRVRGHRAFFSLSSLLLLAGLRCVGDEGDLFNALENGK